MPQQLVFDISKDEATCDVKECDNHATVAITKFFICSDHAKNIAEQLMKVTSAEVTNE